MKIVFTSCMDAERVPSQPVWSEIQALRPDALMLLGDQIYMDWGLASLARKSPWRKRWDAEPTDATLRAFSEEMHWRYSLQWAVPEFKALITTFTQEKGARRLFMCRDEHDFAWNNANGAWDASDERAVPAALADASNRLFAQFRAVLSQPSDWQAGYPALDDTLPDAPATDTMLGAWRVCMPDQRAHRRSRYKPGGPHDPAHEPTLLSDDELRALVAAVNEDTGPLLIAGPSPLKHDYRFSQQGWWANDGSSYLEYQKLLDAAQASGRAVLYLGGDIHRLAYGGPVEPGSSVVQVLASGAAVGRVLLKRFEPSFAWLQVEGPVNQAGRVTIHGRHGGQDLAPVTLAHDATGHWIGTPPSGEATAMAGGAVNWNPVENPANWQGPLSVLTVRRQRGPAHGAGEVSALSGEALDDAYLDALPNDLPYVASSLHLEPHVDLAQIQLCHLLDAPVGDDLHEGIARAFQRALTHERAAVVFFVHGFQKTFSQSIDQACRLRDRFNVEPVLFSWPSGEEGGLLRALNNFAAVSERCQRVSAPLSSALAQFGKAATRYAGRMPATVVARSMGARALSAVFANVPLSANVAQFLRDVRRLVLSAPAVSDGGHRAWLERWPGEAVVTFNADDRTLRAADWLEAGRLLGQSAPAGHRAANATYLDWSHSLAVGSSHDYLLATLGDRIDRLNTLLVTGQAVGDEDLADTGVRRV